MASPIVIKKSHAKAFHFNLSAVKCSAWSHDLQRHYGIFIVYTYIYIYIYLYRENQPNKHQENSLYVAENSFIFIYFDVEQAGTYQLYVERLIHQQKYC